MMSLVLAALLQAQPAPALPAAALPAADSAAQPAWRVAGRAWGACVKGRIDAGLGSTQAAEALADAAMAGCTSQLETVRHAIAAERGDQVAAANVERVRTGGRATFLAYIAQSRSHAPAAAPAH